LFVASKLWVTSSSKVSLAVDKSLKDLQLEYLDLFYVHWLLFSLTLRPLVPDVKTKKLKIDPEGTRRVWGDMEGLVKDGKVKSIGVSNFNIAQLKELIKTAGIKPAANQVELHPYLPQNDLVQYCKEEGIMMVAYSPLGGAPGNLLNDPVVVDIAQDYGATPAQVLISYGLARGYAVIPKSGNPERIQSNYETLELDDNDISRLNELSINNTRFIESKSWSGVDVFAS
jgi:diketogulonate reductase-like aldo/keto reductase